MLAPIALILLAYLIGSIPPGYLLVRASRGLDVRHYGSHSIGATNVCRVGGPWLGLSTLLAEYDPELVNINSWDLSAALVRDVHLAGKEAFVSILGKYDCPWGMRLAIACGADYIQTDHVDVLIPILRAEGLHK